MSEDDAGLPERKSDPGKAAGPEQGLLAFLSDIRPCRSVVEFGRGRTDWLRAAGLLGATETHRIEDLEVSSVQGDPALAANPGKKFDLAICLDGSHNVEDGAAADLVRTLCGASNWILFAADIPGESGARPPNERWIESWAKHFADQDFACYDILRLRFWHDQRVDLHYRQSACLYVRLGAHYALRARGHLPSKRPPSLVHPETFARLAGEIGGEDVQARVRAFYGLEVKPGAGRPA